MVETSYTERKSLHFPFYTDYINIVGQVNSMSRILFVDESSHEVAPFTLELSLRGMEVVHCLDADECLRRIETDANFDLLILDVMLAVDPDCKRSSFSREDTNDFLFTGLVLAQRIRNLYKDLPIVFFTSSSSSILISQIDRTIESIGHSTVLYKHQFSSPLEFGEIVYTLISAGIEAGKNRSWKKWLSDVLIMKPNFAGMGIDLEKLFAPLFKRVKKKNS